MRLHMNSFLGALLLVFFASTMAFAQQDTIVQQRLARKFVREGNKQYQSKKYTEAEAAFKKSQEATAAYYKAAFNLGNTYYQQNKFKEAIPQFELSLKGTNTKQEKATVYHNLGNSYLKQKEYENAIASYKNSLKNSPSDEETRYNLAVAQKLLKQEQDEEDEENKPPPSDFAKRMKKKADALVDKFKFSEALQILDAALEKDETVANYSDYMKKLEAVSKLKTK